MKTNKLQFLNSLSNKFILLGFIIAGIIGAAAYSYLQEAVYRSTITFKVTPEESKNVSINLFESRKTSITEELTSEPFLNKVLEDNKSLVQCFIRSDFKTRYSHYSFPYNITFHSLENNEFEEQHYKFVSATSDSYTLETTSHGVVRTKTGKFGEELIDNDISLVISKKEHPVVPATYLIQKPEYMFTVYSPASLTKLLLQKGNNISATDNDGLITLSVQSKSPVTSNIIASAVAKSFLMNNVSNNDMQQTDEHLKNIEKQIIQTENELSKYKSEHLLTTIEADADAALSFQKDLQLKQTSLKLQLAALDNLTNYLRKNRTVNNSQVEYGVIQDPAFSEQLSRLNSKYEAKENGSATSSTDQEIENLKILISERILNTRKKTAVQIDKINEAIAQNERKVSRIPQQASVISSLERKMELDKLIYNKLIERKANYILDGTAATTVNRIIKPATTPMTPVYPVSWIFVLAGALIGLITGYSILAFTHKERSQKVHTPEELRNETRIPYIATVPTLTNSSAGNSVAISNLCTSVLTMPETKVISFASANRGDGKSFIAGQLAQTLSALDKKVVVLDMNSNSPDMSTIFNISPESSLADVLEGTCDVHDAICLTSFPNIEVLSPGNLPSGINSFLSSSKRDEIMNTLKEHYDFILIDTAVTPDQADAKAMMKISDLNLFIVKANSTRKTSLLNAEKLQKDFNINSLYLILNSNHYAGSSNKSGNTTRTQQRKINVQRQNRSIEPKPKSFLKRIALWFY